MNWRTTSLIALLLFLCAFGKSQNNIQGDVFQISVFEADNTSTAMGWALRPENKSFLKQLAESRTEFGSGFLYRAKNGHIYMLTNAHVIDAGLGEESKIIAIKDDIEYPLEWIGGDTFYDLAVLAFKKNIPRSGQNCFTPGNPSASIGKNIKALANRTGQSRLYQCPGAITQLEINQTGISGWAGYIEHTAILAEGCSGGPLIDENGLVIGMNTRRSSDSVFGYALPINKIIQLTESIINNNGRVQRSYLGVEFHQKFKNDYYKKIKRPVEKIRVVRILPGSPFQNKKIIKPGDYISSVNGIAVKRMSDLLFVLENIKPGDQVKIVKTSDPAGLSNWEEISIRTQTLSDESLETIAKSYVSNHLKLSANFSSNGLKLEGTPKSRELLMGIETPDNQMVSLRIISSQPMEQDNDIRLYRVRNYVDLGIMLRLCCMYGKMKLFYLDEKDDIKIATTIWSPEGNISALYY